MHCEYCGRVIKKTSVPNMAIGPICAVKLHLIAPKPSKLQAARKKWKAFWQAQLDLFEVNA